MRRTLNLIMALFFTVLIGACGAPDGEMEFSPPPQESKSEMYLDLVRDEYSELDSVPDRLLLDLAKNTCDLLDAGGTTDDLFNATQGTGIETEMAGFVTGSAIGIFCPEYADSL